MIHYFEWREEDSGWEFSIERPEVKFCGGKLKRFEGESGGISIILFVLVVLIWCWKDEKEENREICLLKLINICWKLLLINMLRITVDTNASILQKTSSLAFQLKQ
jgi:hypothetical protein